MRYKQKGQQKQLTAEGIVAENSISGRQIWLSTHAWK